MTEKRISRSSDPLALAKVILDLDIRIEPWATEALKEIEAVRAQIAIKCAV